MIASTRWWFSVALLPMAALATTVVPHTLAQRAQASDRVALVQVLSHRVEGPPKNMKTLTEVAVGEDVRGAGPKHLTIVQIGGSSQGYEMHIPSDPHFDVGEVSLVFLKCDGDRCALVALGEGKIQITQDTAVVHDMFSGEFIRRPLREVIAELRAVPLPSKPTGVVTK
jgi:hypothetical protein